MPLYRIYRMKDSPRQQFRWAPHVSGCAAVKPRDFQQSGQIEAPHEYEAWRILRESGQPLEIGDLLEAEDGHLRICKYVGFEPASWVLAHVQPEHPHDAAAAVPDLPSASG